MRKLLLILLLSTLIVSLIVGCASEDNSEVSKSVKLGINSIDRIDVANGTNGEFIPIENDDTKEAILDLIEESNYIPVNKVDESGWIIGIRVYSKGKHYWFMPDGINEYKYENPDFFRELLMIICEEKEIDFVKKYLE